MKTRSSRYVSIYLHPFFHRTHSSFSGSNACASWLQDLIYSIEVIVLWTVAGMGMQTSHLVEWQYSIGFWYFPNPNSTWTFAPLPSGKFQAHHMQYVTPVHDGRAAHVPHQRVHNHCPVSTYDRHPSNKKNPGTNTHAQTHILRNPPQSMDMNDLTYWHTSKHFKMFSVSHDKNLPNFPWYWLLNRNPYFMADYNPHITAWTKNHGDLGCFLGPQPGLLHVPSSLLCTPLRLGWFGQIHAVF